jgi:hypothetical protein
MPIEKRVGLRVKYPLLTLFLLYDLTQNWTVLTHFSKNPEYQFHENPFRCSQVVCCIWTDRQTGHSKADSPIFATSLWTRLKCISSVSAHLWAQPQIRLIAFMSKFGLDQTIFQSKETKSNWPHWFALCLNTMTSNWV